MVRFPAALSANLQQHLRKPPASLCPFTFYPCERVTWAQPLPTLEMTPKLLLSHYAQS